jgi:hypothetical protein
MGCVSSGPVAAMAFGESLVVAGAEHSDGLRRGRSDCPVVLDGGESPTFVPLRTAVPV